MATTLTNPAPDALLTTEEACDAIGCTYRQLHYWSTTGVLVPERMTYGSGTRRRYSAEDVLVGRVVAVLSRMGARGEALLAVSGEVRERIGAAHLDLVWVTPEGFVHEEVPEGELAGWVVNLAALI